MTSNFFFSSFSSSDFSEPVTSISEILVSWMTCSVFGCDTDAYSLPGYVIAYYFPSSDFSRIPLGSTENFDLVIDRSKVSFCSEFLLLRPGERNRPSPLAALNVADSGATEGIGDMASSGLGAALPFILLITELI